MTETIEAPSSKFIDTDQLKKDTLIDLANLTGAMQQHTSLFVHYASQAVRARRAYEGAKANFETLEALLDREHRNALKEENPKTTEAQIRSVIVIDSRFRAAQSKVSDAQAEWKLAEVAERSFDQRKDMLLQIARDAAREGGGQLRVLATQDAKERLLTTMATSAAA